MQCPKCGNQISSDSGFCPICGNKTESGNSYSFGEDLCPKCGAALANGTKFCAVCGYEVGGEMPELKVVKGENAPYVGEKEEKKKNTGLIVLVIILSVIVLLSGLTLTYIFLGGAKGFNLPENEEKPKEEDVEETYDKPVFDTVDASSVLASQGSNYYYPSMATDKKFNTAWQEGADGFGYGEYLKFTANTDQKVSGIKILNGYCKSKDLYYKNNRIRKVKIFFSDGTVITKILNDNFLEYNDIRLDEPVICTSFRIQIVDVYQGTKYDDTGITEVEIY